MLQLGLLTKRLVDLYLRVRLPTSTSMPTEVLSSRMVGSLAAKATKVAKSLALDWLRLDKPVGYAYLVSRMPSCCALAFICAMNADKPCG